MVFVLFFDFFFPEFNEQRTERRFFSEQKEKQKLKGNSAFGFNSTTLKKNFFCGGLCCRRAGMVGNLNFHKKIKKNGKIHEKFNNEKLIKIQSLSQ